MLENSQLYSFINEEKTFTFHFLEGQQIIKNLALLHDQNKSGFQFLRDMVLTTQPIISFLKAGEGLGIFFDSENPYYRFKIECNESGDMRTLLLPENFENNPQVFNGQCRVAKIFPGNNAPYMSIIDGKDVLFEEIINNVLQHSYQVKAEVFLSQESDQSLLIHSLPKKNINKESISSEFLSPKEIWSKYKNAFNELFTLGLNKEAEIINFLKQYNFSLLRKKTVQFKCSCTYDRMLQGVISLSRSMNFEDLFQENSNFIETKCDYCKTYYRIEKDTLVFELSKN